MQILVAILFCVLSLSTPFASTAYMNPSQANLNSQQQPNSPIEHHESNDSETEEETEEEEEENESEKKLKSLFSSSFDLDAKSSALLSSKFYSAPFLDRRKRPPRS